MHSPFAFRAGLIFAAVAGVPATAGAADLELVSRTGIAALHGANGDSSTAARVSPDGRHALFASAAGNLLDGDTNRSTDLFLADAQSGTVERVNLGQNGAQADGETNATADMSADGRYVVFQSAAGNLSASPANTHWQIYLRDRLLQTTTLISRTPAGSPTPTGGYAPRISADGRHVVYVTFDSLLAEDTNNHADVYHYDRAADTTALVSVSAQGEIGDGDSTQAQISADGRYVVFRTGAANLFPGDDNFSEDLVLRDLATGINVAASVRPGGGLFSGSRFLASGNAISADGRYVLFNTAQALDFDDQNAAMDGFRFDRLGGASERVTRGPGGSLIPDGATARALSADGATVVMESASAGLVPGTSSGYRRSYARRIADGSLTPLKIRAGAVVDSDEAEFCNLSGDAAIAYCLSRSRSLAVRNNAGFSNLFRIPVGADSGAQTSLPLELPVAAANGDSGASGGVSSDGRYVVFESIASNLVPGDTNGVTDVFLRDRVAGTTRRISVTAAGLQSSCASRAPQITPDGRYATFESCGALVGNNGLPQIYRYDRVSDTVLLASADASGQPCSSSCRGGDISADGSVVTFSSAATDLVAAPLPAAGGLFVRTLPDGAPLLVNRPFQGSRADGAVLGSAVTGDGRFVYYTDSSTNLVPGDSNGVADVFAYDRLGGTTQRVSLDNAGQQLTIESTLHGVSHDGGSFLARTLSGGFVCTSLGFYVRDLSSGQSECIATNGNEAMLSDDGRRVFYTEWYTPNPDLAQYQEHAFVYDRDSGLHVRVTPADATRSVRLLDACASGNCLLLASQANNLTDDDRNNYVGDVFIAGDLVGERIFADGFQPRP